MGGREQKDEEKVLTYPLVRNFGWDPLSQLNPFRKSVCLLQCRKQSDMRDPRHETSVPRHVN